MAKTTVELIQDNSDIVTGKSTPESLGNIDLGNHLENIINSMKNNNDSNSRSLTRAQILAEVTAGTLIDKQYINVTGRVDGNPLIVQCVGNNKISPYATWIKSGKTIAVMVDYVNGYDGETEVFIAEFGQSTGIPANDRKLRLNSSIVIYDGSQKKHGVLVSDDNGVGSWQLAGSGSTNSTFNTPAISNTGAFFLATGQGFLVNTGKTGKLLFTLMGQYQSSHTVGVSIGLACRERPTNFIFGELVDPNFIQNKFTESPPIANEKRVFVLTNIVTFAVGKTIAFDVCVIGTALSQTIQIYGGTLTVVEI